MMKCLLLKMRASNQEIMVKMRTNQAKVGANLKEIKEGIKTNKVKGDHRRYEGLAKTDEG
jgi:hypothetical protein